MDREGEEASWKGVVDGQGKVKYGTKSGKRHKKGGNYKEFYYFCIQNLFCFSFKEVYYQIL